MKERDFELISIAMPKPHVNNTPSITWQTNAYLQEYRRLPSSKQCLWCSPLSNDGSTAWTTVVIWPKPGACDWTPWPPWVALLLWSWLCCCCWSSSFWWASGVGVWWCDPEVVWWRPFGVCARVADWAGADGWRHKSTFGTGATLPWIEANNDSCERELRKTPPCAPLKNKKDNKMLA